ncbi:MAG: hypothetical protein DWP92_08720 [Armatimonadetes bacterium]|nr:MAG: hypothetical protein DWP92_08720 [Armatimonadota bacterium]
MDDDALRMKEAFLEAYPRYVVRILNERGIELTELVADAIVDGSSTLDGLLQRLVDTPMDEQRHSPLELFRESLRPVDRALALSGVPAPAIDEAHRRLHSWDVYTLCPGSSQALGPSAHDAHLRWGIGKAMAVGAFTRRTAPDRPMVALLCREGDREHLDGSLLAAGYRSVDGVEDGAVLALVDIDVNSDVVSEMVGLGIRVIAYGDQVTDISTVGLRAAGVWKVVPRSTVLTSIGAIVPIIG